MSAVATSEMEPGARPFERVSLGRLARQGAVIGAIVLVLVFGTRVATTLLLLTRFAPDQDRYAKAAAAANLAHTGMLDQETGLRAFLITHDQTYLLPYSRGQKELADGNLELASLVGADSQLAGDVHDVEGAQQRWVDGWALPALSAGDVTTGGNLPDFLTRGKILFDDYRTYDARLVRDVSDQQAAALKTQDTALVGASLFELVLMIAAAVFAVVRLRRMRRELADPVTRVTVALEALVAGRYETRVEASGRVSEFAPISHASDHLARTLAALSLAAGQRERENAEQSSRQRQLLELTRDIAGSLSLRYILRSVGESAVKVTPYDVVSVWLVEEEGRGLLVPTYVSSGADGQPFGLAPLELGVSLPGLAAKYGQAFRRDAGSDPPAGYQPELTARAIAVPMIVGARCVGVIELASSRPELAGAVDVALIETLAIHAGAAIEAARLHRRSEEQAQVDALTRLFNRRRLDADLTQEVARAVRYGRPLSFIMLDTDHFKRLNDDLGHQKGDEVLHEVATLLREGLRLTDTAYRYGGEEFGLLLRESNLQDAAKAAERIRSRIEQRFGGPGNPARVTASFGVAALGPGVETAEELIRAADHALYEAKQAGRNRVEVAADDGPPRPAIRPMA